jgi:hypothetical protein
MHDRVVKVAVGGDVLRRPNPQNRVQGEQDGQLSDERSSPRTD